MKTMNDTGFFAMLAKMLTSGPSLEHVTKGRTKKVRSGNVPTAHSEPRFSRKTRKFGAEYRPGKLFKGHRV